MATLADYKVLLLEEISLDQKTSSLVMTIAQNVAKKNDKVCLSLTHMLLELHSLTKNEY